MSSVINIFNILNINLNVLFIFFLYINIDLKHFKLNIFLSLVYHISNIIIILIPNFFILIKWVILMLQSTRKYYKLK